MITYVVIYFLITLGWVFFFSRLSGGAAQSVLWRALLYGMIAGPVAGSVSFAVKGTFLSAAGNTTEFLWNQFFLYFLIVGPIEEAVKFLAFFFATVKKDALQKPSEVIFVALVTALGFAGGENILFLLSYGLEATLPRLILGNLGHAGYAVFWGYAYAMVLLQDAKGGLLFAALLVASMVHGFYNYLLIFSLPGAIFSFVITLALFVFIFWLLRFEREQS